MHHLKAECLSQQVRFPPSYCTILFFPPYSYLFVLLLAASPPPPPPIIKGMLKRFQQMSMRHGFSAPNRFSQAAIDEVNEVKTRVWQGHLVGKFFAHVNIAFNAIKSAREKVLSAKPNMMMLYSSRIRKLVKLRNMIDGERALHKQPIIVYNSATMQGGKS